MWRYGNRLRTGKAWQKTVAIVNSATLMRNYDGRQIVADWLAVLSANKYAIILASLYDVCRIRVFIRAQVAMAALE